MFLIESYALMSDTAEPRNILTYFDTTSIISKFLWMDVLSSRFIVLNDVYLWGCCAGHQQVFEKFIFLQYES